MAPTATTTPSPPWRCRRDGGVKRVANTHTEGTIPRSLTLDPTGKFLYSLNQSADNVATFRLDANGVPKFTGKFLGIGSPGGDGVPAVTEGETRWIKDNS